MPLESHRQRFGIVAPAAADFALHVYVGQKIHFDAAETVALASFAAPALHVKAEAPGAVAALARFRKHGEELANRREHTGISSGIRARRAADGRLIDLNHFVDLLGANDLAVSAGRLHRAIKLLRQRAVQNVVDQRGLAGSRDAGDHGEQPERKRDVHIL